MKVRWLVLGTAVLFFLMAVPPFALADNPPTDRAGRAEVRFLEGLVDHDQNALGMAHDCLAKAKTEAIRKFCQQVADARSVETKTMRGWLLIWYQLDYGSVNSSSMSMMDMMGMNGMMNMMMSSMDCTKMGMNGMMNPSGNQGKAPNNSDMMGQSSATTTTPTPTPGSSDMMGMMPAQNAVSASAYEAGWLETMSDHDDDVANMAQRVLKYAKHPELRDAVQKILDGRKAEMATIETLITTSNPK